MEGEELENVVEAIHMARTKKLRSHHIYSSSDSFTHVDVYPFYDIGKAVKKFIECKRQPWVKTTACMGSSHTI